MVARILTKKSIKAMLYYNQHKVNAGEAQLIMGSGFAAEVDRLSFGQLLMRFERLTELNAKVKTNAVHISLNFAPEDQPDNHVLAQIAAEYMERIGFGEQPFLVYRHFDASHTHIHIATTNIKRDGNRIDLHNIGRTKSEDARKALEEKYGLTPAQGRSKHEGLALKPAVYGAKPTKQQLNTIINAVTKSYAFTSLPQMNAVLAEFNVRASRGLEDSAMFRHRGLQYAILDDDGRPIGVPIKASAFAAKPTLDHLEKLFARNKQRQVRAADNLKKFLDRVIASGIKLNLHDFQSLLQKQQISLVLRQSQTGLIYGVTFVDHRQKAVLNGSDLGKAYSAKALLERFPEKSPYQAALSFRHNDNEHRQTPEAAAQQDTLLDTLLAQTRPDYSPGLPKKRHRKKRGQQTQQQLTL